MAVVVVMVVMVKMVKMVEMEETDGVGEDGCRREGIGGISEKARDTISRRQASQR